MNERILELDILRGLTIALMIIVNSTLGPIYKILQHAAWEGLTLTDAIFPAFVFAMGAAAAISTSRRQPTLRKILIRTGILFLAGFLLNVLIYFCFEQAHVRFWGVLQRFALTYFFGILILLKLKNNAQIFFAAFLLLIISSVGFHVYAPENPFAEEKNISGAIDLIFPGVNYIYTPTHDPEGLYGVLASTASMLFGILAGNFLLKNERWKIILCGAGILICGCCWSFFDIVAKKIWTAPFALLNAGGDMIFLAVIWFLIKFLPRTKKIFRPFESLGKNPLFFFVASEIALTVLVTVKIGGVPILGWIYRHTLQGNFGAELGTLIFCVVWCLLWIIPAEILNRRGIILKL